MFKEITNFNYETNLLYQVKINNFGKLILKRKHMLTLKHNCPHCFTNNCGFSFVCFKLNNVKSVRNRKLWNILFECNSCGGPLVAESMSSLNLNIQTLEGNLQLVENISIINYYPNAANTDIPQCLPESVHKSFLEGVQTKNNQPNAACAMFRRSLEISLKIVDQISVVIFII